jgi:hypothetical protein
MRLDEPIKLAIDTGKASVHLRLETRVTKLRVLPLFNEPGNHRRRQLTDRARQPVHLHFDDLDAFRQAVHFTFDDLHAFRQVINPVRHHAAFPRVYHRQKA